MLSIQKLQVRGQSLPLLKHGLRLPHLDPTFKSIGSGTQVYFAPLPKANFSLFLSS